MKSDRSFPDVIVPVELETDQPTDEIIVRDIAEQHRKYGFTRFMLAAPSAGRRSAAFPDEAVYIRLAERFSRIRDALKPQGVTLGWWNCLTVKTGSSPQMVRQVGSDGVSSALASCPRDPVFRTVFSDRTALFARMAKPEFIFLEDDFTLADRFGCFCPGCLAAFGKRMQRMYSREELTEAFRAGDIALLRAWRDFSGESLTGLAAAIRAAVDRETPEIPIGSMQSGGSDKDGNCTEAVARALAGDRHVPFSRLYGCFYMGGHSHAIPHALFHPLYSRQHLPLPFRFYHEADSYPHTGFFTSAAQMRAMMALSCSYGFDGYTFQTQQMLDRANEDGRYGAMYASLRPMLQSAGRIAKHCRVDGAELCYDPFFNTLNPETAGGDVLPLWLEPLAAFGIPYTSLRAKVALWDIRQAAYADDRTVREYLSGGLILDADSASELSRRGYGQYLGVKIGERLDTGAFRLDLGAREVILPPFAEEAFGTHMPAAHIYAGGKNGAAFRMTVTDPACEMLSEVRDFRGNPVTPGMTRFENALGGRIVVMGQSLCGNRSHSLINYRRGRLLRRLIRWCRGNVATVEDQPRVLTVMNSAAEPDSPFEGMLTLLNLCDDPVRNIRLCLPDRWRMCRDIRILREDGEWVPLPFVRLSDGVEAETECGYLNPVFLLFIR